MLDLPSIGVEIARRRRELKLTQAALSRRARVSRATLDAIENGRAGEVGFSRLDRLLNAIGLELALRPRTASTRPTLDDLLQENRDAESLDRRR